jgi:hypothetical protein
MIILHPQPRSLVAFASGEPFTGRPSVARHLERCSECRQFVGFAQRLEKAAISLPTPEADRRLLSKALADRAEGARVILPALIEPAEPSTRGGAIATAAALIIVTLLGVWLNGRGPRNEFTSANELLLAGFVPRNAEAGQGRAADVLTHHLRPMKVTYQKRFIDSATGRVDSAGKFDIQVSPADSLWLVTSAWREIAGRPDVQGAHAWAESVTVADAGFAPSARIVHVKPYRKWAGIFIDQRFKNDSVVGQMALDEDPTRRPIVHDLRAQRNRLIASDALAPFYFMGVPLLPGAEFDVRVLGWAVVPNDVFLPMHMKVLGSERVATPAGTFDCWKFAISVGEATHYHWVRKSDHLGVLTRRVADGKTRELVLIKERK